MNKELARKISTEAEQALRIIAENHGLRLSNRGGSLDEFQFVAKFEFNEGNEEEKYKSEWSWGAKLYAHRGLKEEWLGKEIWTPKGVSTVIGLHTKSKKYPVALKTKAGKIYFTTIENVTGQLKGKVL